jgi:hypothetical protein
MWKSKYTNGEKCHCGEDAIAKVGEEIMNDDPFSARHNLTAYICEKHYRELFGNYGVDLVDGMRKKTMDQIKFREHMNKLSGNRDIDIAEELRTDQIILKDFMDKK